MKTLEQLRAELEAQNETALKAHALKIERAARFAEAELPLPEYLGDSLLHGAVTATYRNDWQKGARSLAQAVDLLQAFADRGAIVPAHVLKASCTMFHPETHLPQREAAQGYKRDAYRNAGYAVELRVSYMVRSPGGASASLEFFAMLGDTLHRVTVEFGNGFIGSCPQLAPRVITRTGHHASTVEGFEPRPCLCAADARINYAGTRGEHGLESSDMRFLFTSDHDDGPGTTVSHAAEALRNIAGEVKA